jgi:hypothetical protein
VTVVVCKVASADDVNEVVSDLIELHESSKSDDARDGLAGVVMG